MCGYDKGLGDRGNGKDEISQSSNKEVENFKYLRSKIGTSESVKEEIRERIRNAGKFYQLVRFIGKWEMLENGKMCLFKSCYVYKFMYGAETWTWTKADISRLMT